MQLCALSDIDCTKSGYPGTIERACIHEKCIVHPRGVRAAYTWSTACRPPEKLEAS